MLRICFYFFIFIGNVLASEQQIPFKDIFLKIPESTGRAVDTALDREALPYWGVLLGTTGILYHYDEKISSSVRYHANNWHIGRHYRTHNSFEMKGNLLNFPRDIGSMLYFSGDGFIHIAGAAGLIVAGKLNGNNYHVNSGIMILHGLTMTGLYAQVLKRSFGRESPVESTQPRGAWHPFPTFHQYQSNTAKYDAMPSGHMMTATLTFTVLASRYSTYEIPIIAVGTLWVGSLGFEMLNNGVHWASDYPLGIAMGYLLGRSVTKMGKKDVAANNQTTSWDFSPTFHNGTSGLMARKEF